LTAWTGAEAGTSDAAGDGAVPGLSATTGPGLPPHRSSSNRHIKTTADKIPAAFLILLLFWSLSPIRQPLSSITQAQGAKYKIPKKKSKKTRGD
jgi:hypothetical protein